MKSFPKPTGAEVTLALLLHLNLLTESTTEKNLESIDVRMLMPKSMVQQLNRLKEKTAEGLAAILPILLMRGASRILELVENESALADEIANGVLANVERSSKESK